MIAPLSRAVEWVNTTDSKGRPAKREINTMPGAAGSSWYFLRFCDPHNDAEFCSRAASDYWMPVDLYVGGTEHAVGHLLYSRFWNKVLHDAGHVAHDEPFRKLFNQGMILSFAYQDGRGATIPQAQVEDHGDGTWTHKETGEARKAASGPPSWTQVFGDAITGLAEEREDVIAVTAAMPSGSGTAIFQKRFPERFFDVGIAEGHAVTFAAGAATQGIRPIVAIYSTFLQRGYDNIIHDVAVQHLPVTFCMDRAGLVGEDGQTHMGLYDIPYMLAVPGMTVTAPKDADELIGLLRTALDHDGPFCTRYPRDKAPEDPNPVGSVPAIPYGTWELLRPGRDVAILGTGTMALPAARAAELLAAEGIDAAAINARFLLMSATFRPWIEGLDRRLVYFSLLFLTFVATSVAHWPDMWSMWSDLLAGYSITDRGHGNFKLPLLFVVMLLPLIFSGGGKLSLDYLFGIPLGADPKPPGLADFGAFGLAALVLGLPFLMLVPMFGATLIVIGVALLAFQRWVVG